MDTTVSSYPENYDLYWQISYVCAGLNLLLGPLGVFFNGMIAVAIYRIKSYRKTSHYLLAALALSDMGTSLVMVNQSFLVFSGYCYVLVTSGACFWRMWYCHFMIYFNSSIIFGVGLDRLYAVTFPVKYAHSKKRWFLAGVLVSATSVAVTGVVLGVFSVDEETVIANCGTSNSLGGIGRAAFERINMSLTALAILVYCLAYYKTKKRAKEHSEASGTQKTISQIETDKQNQHLMTSLMIILAFIVLSRLFGFSFAKIVRLLPIDDKMVISAISMFSSIASLPDKYTNFFIFGFRSKDYKKEFQKILHLKVTNPTKIHSATMNTKKEVIPKQKVTTVAANVPQNGAGSSGDAKIGKSLPEVKG